ncbi:glycosyltransferase [bacterium]|nr:glycosyltransferase [bacterium]
MDRLFHLKETYLKNISRAGSDVEFILLDYGSSDGVGEWAAQNLSGVKLIRTNARYWVASHAKNIVHKAASGDILCNLDCDVTIPEGFSDYLREELSAGNRIASSEERDEFGNYGCSGLVAVLKNHFYSVNGYDESMNLGWGFDSSNFTFRVSKKNSLETSLIRGAVCLPHSDEFRTARCQLKEISFTSAMSSRISDAMAESEDYVANRFSEWGVSDILPALAEGTDPPRTSYF